MNIPTELNGYRVIKSQAHANVVTVMMVAPDKFIVATWWPELGTSWQWGHYRHHDGSTAGMNDVRDDIDNVFDDVCRRNEKR